jgi:hypothetical protein
MYKGILARLYTTSLLHDVESHAECIIVELLEYPI